MSVSTLGLVDAFCACLLVFIVHRLLFPKSSLVPHPPGPRGLPLVGNVLDLPSHDESKVYARMSEKYGNIIRFNVLGQHIVILNSAQMAVDLLEERSRLYSDRPKLLVSGELVGFNNTLVLSAYDSPRFRGHRRNFHKMIGSKGSVERYISLQEDEAHKFLLRVLQEPSMLEKHIHLATAGIILSISYAYVPASLDDPLVRLSDEVMTLFSLLSTPGAFLVDTFPSLAKIPEWFPGSGWKKMVPEWQAVMLDMVARPLEILKTTLSLRPDTPCLATDLMKEGLTPEEEDLLKWSTGSMYAAGADTTFSSIYHFYRAMILHPEIQKRAQEEIDSVIGRDRLPGYTDRPSLPYVDALLKEVLRWGPVAPLGVPHRLMEDDIYNGYYLPAGTIIMANIRHFLTDPAVYSDPETFNPERFLGSCPEPDPHSLVFGFGRRVCPGNLLADATLFVMINKTLAAFTLSMPVDPSTGSTVKPPPGLAGAGSLVKRAVSFRCDIKPRHAGSIDLIHEAQLQHS